MQYFYLLFSYIIFDYLNNIDLTTAYNVLIYKQAFIIKFFF